MNKIYKVIWNEVRHCFVCVSELAKSHHKPKSRRGLARKATAVAAAGLSAALLVTAAPAGVFAATEVHDVSTTSKNAATDTNYDNDGATGADSVAIGVNASSKGDGAVALGKNAEATGPAATVIGENADASGSHAVAFDYVETDTETPQLKNVAGGTNSFAYGDHTRALGMDSTAFGRDTYVGEAAKYGTAFGVSTSVTGARGTDFGLGTSASGQQATAFGNETTASHYGSTAFGNRTISAGSYATAFGNYTVAAGANSLAFGTDTSAGANVTHAQTEKLFPDIAKNHWAYEAVRELSRRGLVEGYPDGTFGGDLLLTRYEFAMVVYRAIQGGADVPERLVTEFEPELSRIRVDALAHDKDGKPTIERVRVNKDYPEHRNVIAKKS